MPHLGLVNEVVRNINLSQSSTKKAAFHITKLRFLEPWSFFLEQRTVPFDKYLIHQTIVSAVVITWSEVLIIDMSIKGESIPVKTSPILIRLENTDTARVLSFKQTVQHVLKILNYSLYIVLHSQCVNKVNMSLNRKISWSNIHTY